MRTWTPGITAAVLALGVAAPTLAQEEQAPPYVEVTQLRFSPADAEGFLDMVKTVRDAAVEARLDPGFAWDTYRRDNIVYFVTFHESMADFEDPEAFVRAFEGTSVADRVMAAFERSMAYQVREGLNEVSRTRPDLGYVPATPAVAPGEQEGVFILRQWPAGDMQAYEESLKDFMGMLTEMGAPYPVVVNQNLIGKGGYVIAVLFDDLGSFYGPNSLEEGLAASGMAARWGEHQTAHRQLVSDVTTFHVMYLPEHSYRPEPM